MKRTIDLKEKWTEATLQIQHKSGVINYTPEYMFISNMFIGAIMDKKPLSSNDIVTIECMIRVKLFEYGLL